MKQYLRSLAMVVTWAAVAAGQLVPDQYVVELSEEPLGAAVRTKGKAALSDRHRTILSEQARAKSAIERSRGRVLASVDSLMNALIVNAPDAAALSAIHGVKAVYPVTLAHATATCRRIATRSTARPRRHPSTVVQHRGQPRQ